jgi:hypothetical protein
MNTIERLEELLAKKDQELEEKDAELQKASEENDRLERELKGSLDGWRHSVELPDDDLPVPRLEVVYVLDDGWSDFRVIYRLVMKHLLGNLVAIPLSYTKISGGPNKEPEADHLPFRDGAHMAHDAALFGIPAFKLLPGKLPKRLDLSGYGATEKGQKDRRP